MTWPRRGIADPTVRRRTWQVALVGIAVWVLLDFVMPHAISAPHTSTGHWQTPLPAVFEGVIIGSTYGLLAVGLVLIYRSNRIINFAHGEVGAFAASFFGLEVVQWHIPYWVALIPALVVAAAVGVVLDLLVVRRLVKAPLVMSVVGTLAAGQFLSLFALVINSHANAAIEFPQPTGLPGFQFGALYVTPAFVATLILAPIAVAATGVFLKATRYGRGIRSAAANPDAARMAGIPVRRMSSIAWALAGVLAALSAILAQAASGFNGGDSFGPSLLLVALTGAVFARMRSLPRALLGGIAIGVVQQLLLWNASNSGLFELVLFVGIVGASLLQKQQFGRGEDTGAWSITQVARPLPAQIRALRSVKVLERGPWMLVIALLAVLPLVVSNATSIKLAITFAFVVVAVSIGVVTGLGGQLSLGQFAIAAVGAYASFEVSRRTGNFFESFACAALAGGIAAVVLGLPAIRARGLMFSVTTLAFGLVMPDYLLGQSWVLGSARNPGRPILFHHAFISGHSYYYVGLVTMLIGFGFARNVHRGGVGRRLVALRDNEDAARAFTVSATWTKVQGFAVAGGLAGLAGAMYGHALSQLSVDGFPIGSSIDVVKIAVLGGLGSLSGPIFGAVLVQGTDYVALGTLGVALLSLAQLLIILYLPGGFVQVAIGLRDRVAGVLARRAGIDLATVVAAERGGAAVAHTALRGLPEFARPGQGGPAEGVLLEVADLDKSFAGIHAVRGLNLTVTAGETLGLIGPNGAGKTTTFELIAGFIRADAGTVRYRGADITRLPPEARAKHGMIRSFQDAALFPTLTVAECMAVAMERTDPTSVPLSLIGDGRRDRRKLVHAEEMLAWMGLASYRASRIRDLSTGTRRITEIACLVALRPELLLLDEPSSGVAQHETDALGELLVRLRDELSLSLIVIEHDIPLVMGLSDRVVCMADGVEIATGSPAEIQADPKVIEAYLGTSVANVPAPVEKQSRSL